jgi:hypothetical protein
MSSLTCNLRWLPWTLGCQVLSHHHSHSPFLSIARGCLFRHQLTSLHFWQKPLIELVFYLQIYICRSEYCSCFLFSNLRFVRVKVLFKTWHKSIIKFNFIPLCLNLFIDNYSIFKPFNKLQIFVSFIQVHIIQVVFYWFEPC